MTLTNVEGAFRALKTDLGMRPVYHQNKEFINWQELDCSDVIFLRNEAT